MLPLTIDNFPWMLNNEELFGSPDKCLITGCEEELDEVFGESGLDIERFANFYVCFCEI